MKIFGGKIEENVLQFWPFTTYPTTALQNVCFLHSTIAVVLYRVIYMNEKLYFILYR